MKKIIFLVWLLCACAIAPAHGKVPATRERLFDRDRSAVLVVAHRGDWRNAPENSLRAIANAIEMGVDIVEIDVQRTKDGHFILMHDQTLDRTTTGSGLIADWTLDSIRTLGLRNGCGIATKHPIPTLEEALVFAQGKVMLNLDKADRYFDEIYPLLAKTGTTEQIVMKGRKGPQEVKELYGAYLSSVIYMPIVDLDDPEAMATIHLFIQEMQPVAFEFLYVDDSNPLPVAIANEMDEEALIWYNTLWDTMAGGHDDDASLEDPARGYGFLIDTLGARILQTDRPAYLIEYLRKRGMHD